MSIVGRVTFFAVSAVIGFGQGFQPICGFNYGAGRYDRVRSSFWFSVRFSFVVLLSASIVGELFAPQIVNLFLKGHPDVTQIGALGLRMQCILLPLSGFIMMSNMRRGRVKHRQFGGLGLSARGVRARFPFSLTRQYGKNIRCSP